jgi:hypothetical protein
VSGTVRQCRENSTVGRAASRMRRVVILHDVSPAISAAVEFPFAASPRIRSDPRTDTLSFIRKEGVPVDVPPRENSGVSLAAGQAVRKNIPRTSMTVP